MDVLAILSYISEQAHSPPPVLVGHSTEGGLVQYVLNRHGDHLCKENGMGGMIHKLAQNRSNSTPPNDTVRQRIYSAQHPMQESAELFLEFHIRGSGEDTVPEGFMDQMNKEEISRWGCELSVLKFDLEGHHLMHDM
ncbi:hypothetical protein BDQ17DRAFT_1414488 [Cyathus striatus]|nr:hypothetical protein BDQ17DRAFT_1414488 [Cyathus striatus]